MTHPRPHRQKLTLVPGGRRTRGRLAWTRSVELVLFATALLAVGLALARIDDVSRAAHEETPAAHAALPRLHEVVADILARAEAHERPGLRTSAP